MNRIENAFKSKPIFMPYFPLGYPDLESSHAVAEVIKRAPTMRKDQMILVNLSGRGDKDLNTAIKELGAS